MTPIHFNSIVNFTQYIFYTMANLETILSWFQTGDNPTEEEFRQTFSSFRHNDTKIPIKDVDGLESSLKPQSDWNQSDSSVADFIKNKPDLSLKADLVAGKVPASQLPSYVDDVLEFGSLRRFPVTGESGKLYLALDANRLYRWSGSVYIEVSAGSLQESTLYPKIKILDFTSDATNYIIRVASNQSFPLATYSGTQFEVSVGSSPIIATDISVVEDTLNKLTTTNSPFPSQGRITTILIPKVSNPFGWNNGNLALMVTLLAVDNGDGGSSSPYSPRRIASDVDFIANLRPSLKDDFSKFSNISNVEYTSDMTNYYVDGLVHIASEISIANNNSGMNLVYFAFNGYELNNNGITYETLTPVHFMGSTNPANIPDSIGGLNRVNYTSYRFRITIPKNTNTLSFNNTGAWFGFLLQCNSFDDNNLRKPITIPYSMRALFTNVVEIKQFSDNFTGTTITLTKTPKINTIVNVLQNGLTLRQGATRDYIISENTIVFNSKRENVDIEINYTS